MDPILQAVCFLVLATYLATGIMVAAGAARVLWEVVANHGPMHEYRAFLRQEGHSTTFMLEAGYVLAVVGVASCALLMGAGWYFMADLSAKGGWAKRMFRACAARQEEVRSYAVQWAAEKNLGSGGHHG